MTADEWCRDNERRLRGVARRLYLRWRLPPAVDVEDVEQELRLAVCEVLGGYDAARGRSLDDYLIWNAAQRTKGWLHRQRESPRRRGTAEGRYALGVEWVEDAPTDDVREVEALLDLYREIRRLVEASRAERLDACGAALARHGFADGDWHGRLLASRSIGLFASSEVQTWVRKLRESR